MMIENNVPAWHGLVNGTEAQIRALKSEKALTVVSAGAGTGKTQTLAQRYAWLLAKDPECKVEEILVLTFTKKAAREMQERIKGTLVRWSEAAPVELAHLRERAASLEDGYISTIHSFAMKMIRESGLELDIDPMAAIMPAPREDVWWREFQELLSEASLERLAALLPQDWRGRAAYFASELKDGELADIINGYGPDELAQAAKECAEKLYCAGQSPDTLWDKDDSELMRSVASESGLRLEIFELWIRDVLPAASASPGWDKGGVLKNKLEELSTKWSGSEPNEENLSAFVAELIGYTLYKPPSNGKLKSAIEDVLGSKITEWRNEMDERLKRAVPPSDEERRINRLLTRLCAICWACWDEFRGREGLLTLSDLIRYASQLLAASPEYKRKFKHILVDEFQDTDPLQDSLIRSLWSGPSEEEEQRGNTLFIVGDAKQSIYRFRHADLTLFRGYIAECEKLGPKHAEYVALDQNFRTNAPLLEKFNEVFGAIWQNSPTLKYEPLVPPADERARKRRSHGAEPPYLEALIATEEQKQENDSTSTEKISIERLRELLYLQLGAELKDMRDKKCRVWDKKMNGDPEIEEPSRPVRWSDFAVLVPSRRSYLSIERAFERLGIPYLLSTNKNYFSRGEIGDLVNMISMLNDMENPIFLAGFLASPFSGLPLSEAERLLAMALGKKEARSPLPLAAAVREEQPELWRRIGELRRLALLKGASAVILEELKRPAFLESYSGLRRRRVNANIIYLAQLAEEYEKSEGRSLSGCAKYLLSSVSAQGAKEEPDAVDEDTDAVRVMTIHASKGLEFPIVALACFEKSAGGRSSIMVSKKYGVVSVRLPEYLSIDRDVKTVAGLWERTENEEAEKAESERLWYVGFTRAQDRLILCSAEKNTKNDNKRSFFSNIIESGIPDVVKEDSKSPVEMERAEPSPQKTQAERLTLKSVSPAMLGRISASAYAMISWCPVAYRMVYRQGRTPGWTVKGGEGRGADFGSLTHWVLARWNFTKDGLEEWFPPLRSQRFERLMRRVPVELREEYSSRAKRGALLKMLCEFAASDCGAKYSSLAAPESTVRLMRETPFRVPLDGLVLVGATDLFWQDGEGLHLRDWKSSREEDAPEFYYQSQLDFYALALSRFSAGTDSQRPLKLDSALVYLGAGANEGEPRRFARDEIAKIEVMVRDAAALALSGKFTPASGRCSACPWSGICPENKRRKVF